MCKEKSKEDAEFVVPLFIPCELAELLTAGREAIKNDPKMGDISGEKSDYCKQI